MSFIKKFLNSNKKGTFASKIKSWASSWDILSTDNRYDEMAQFGYCSNVIAYRSIQMIARGLSSVPWLLYKDQRTELEIHPLLSLLKSPNMRQADATFREELVSHLLICGNAYILKTLNSKNQPIELSILRPDRVKILKTESGAPKCYEYTVGQKSYHFPIDPIHGNSQILHIKFFNPLNDYQGMGPLQAAASSIDQHNAVGNHNLALLQNGGRPSGAFIVRPNPHGVPLTDRQRESLSKDLRQAYEGATNAGRVLFLEGDFDWREMGLSLKDLDFIDGKNLSAREIAQAFGVPPMLVGVLGDATFANYKEARYHLWEDTILPLFDLIIGEFNRWLCPHYNMNLHLAYDADRIPALTLRRESSWEKIAHVNFLTLNEKREAVGYGYIENGDNLS
ncbi:MAG: hypothetical protein NEHIOOID_00971 [Holosporales bacterium]